MRFLCRLGFHNWYIDGAAFSSAERCNFCPAVKDPIEAAQLYRERQIWKKIQEEEPNLKGDALLGRVASRLFSSEELLKLN